MLFQNMILIKQHMGLSTWTRKSHREPYQVNTVHSIKKFIRLNDTHYVIFVLNNDLFFKKKFNKINNLNSFIIKFDIYVYLNPSLRSKTSCHVDAEKNLKDLRLYLIPCFLFQYIAFIQSVYRIPQFSE